MAKKVPTTVSKVTADKPSNLFRRLSAVLLINTAEFAKAAPTTQTKTIAAADGLPVEFVADFLDLGNKRIIRDKLLSGKDVSRELEFNGVKLDAEELQALDLIKPVLAKIEAIGPSYPWLPVVDHSATIKFTGTDKRTINRNGHTLSRSVAEMIWKKASRFWSGGGRPASYDVRTDGYGYANKTASFTATHVSIGCQTIERSEVEFIARHYGFEPVVAE